MRTALSLSLLGVALLSAGCGDKAAGGDSGCEVQDWYADTDGDGATNDQLDVSALRDLEGNPVDIWDVTVSDDGSGNAILTFPEGETVPLQGISPAQMTGPQMNAMGIPCR